MTAAMDSSLSHLPASSCLADGARTLAPYVVPSDAELGKLCGFAGTATDLTELFEEEEALGRQGAFTSSLLEDHQLPTCLTDSGGRFLSVNNAWEKMMGLSRKTVLGKRDFDFLSIEEAQVHGQHHLRLLRMGGHIHYEQSLRLAHAGVRDFEIVKVFIQGARYQPSSVLMVAMDVTELRSETGPNRRNSSIAPEAKKNLPQTARSLRAALSA